MSCLLLFIFELLPINKLFVMFSKTISPSPNCPTSTLLVCSCCYCERRIWMYYQNAHLPFLCQSNCDGDLSLESPFCCLQSEISNLLDCNMWLNKSLIFILKVVRFVYINEDLILLDVSNIIFEKRYLLH